MGQIRFNSTTFSRDVIYEEGSKVRDIIATAIEAEQGLFNENEFAFKYELIDDQGHRVKDFSREAKFMDGRTFTIQEKGIRFGFN